ncbi:hypothetical protein A2876_04350 [Candidatus Amesbacteria bacterium RIFCSPHIGHO2_01_FULL_48_32b]|uniref:VIT family protein n=1 Tax=Candidatus Amesbacteria bacterium RIFCSPHIGHO2_01_FULL_48_32b TaxID=1797253 RepID=A0A1F4YEE9_9BACT|nr:MAG: hypothetical protein A2876_04350 [Candidatus Amesbacteria bacterium RIFCSPHIGHO2_01_FULL_48_32b]
MSMGVGSFLTEQSVSEFKTHHDLPLSKSLPGSLVMFFSYLFSGLIPLSPYIFLPPSSALWFSVALSLSSLCLLGLINARISGTNLFRQARRMLILGGSVAVSGVFLGVFLKGI